MKQIIRIGSRASRLAVLQSELVMEQIRRILPDAELELVTMKTTGDKILNRTLDQIGGKGLFLKELDAALLAGAVDLCVHSLKDVPAEENPAIPIGAFSERAVPADVLVLPAGVQTWDRTKPVGCASARRSMQLRQLYPDVTVKPVRGNVLTRLEKLDRGELLTLAASSYVLVEYLPSVSYGALFRSLRTLRLDGYLPILAHAERYGALRTEGLEQASASR